MKRGIGFKLVILGLAIGFLSCVLQAFAAEEKWPARPIKILVPYNAGGGMDMMSRILSEAMRKTLDVSMPVINMQGAVGAIGTDYVYKQPRDGYTLYALSSGICTFPATGVSKYTYKEFGVIGICFEALPVYIVAYDSPIKNMNDLIDGLKKGNLTGSNTGIGGIWHVPQVIVNSLVGGKFKVVPYNSGTDSALAAAKKEVDFATCDIAEAQVYIREKMLRPLCVVDDKPFQLEGSGTIPAVTEFIPKMKDKLMAAKGWRALGYAKGIPEDSIQKLIRAFRTAVESDMVKDFSKKSLLAINGLTGSEADKVFASTTQILSWLLYDLKEAKKSPEELGIPRYDK
jgi:tripartite-type tricarboxylate transporter receptor subunit TctC